MSSTPKLIPPSQIVKAHEIYLKSLQVREDWMAEEKEKPTVQNKPCIPSHKDNIVDRVMKSENLCKYESKLLGCIVKPGTHLLLIQEHNSLLL